MTALDILAEALFASPLQPSDHPTREQERAAICDALRRHHLDGCAERLADAYGDHPDEAAERMRWCRCEAARAYDLVTDGTPWNAKWISA